MSFSVNICIKFSQIHRDHDRCAGFPIGFGEELLPTDWLLQIDLQVSPKTSHQALHLLPGGLVS